MKYEEHINEWIEQANDYPTKSLLTLALEEYQKQEEYLQIFQGKLDGSIWSPEAWQED